MVTIWRSPFTTEEIAEEVGKEFGVKPDDLFQRYSREGGARQAVTELSCRYAIRSVSFREIGQKMGVSVGGLARNRMRFQERLKKDRVLLKRFDRIEKILLYRS